MRSRLIALIVPLLVLAMGAVGTAAASPGTGGERVDVIVVLHDGADARDAARDAARTQDADVTFVYEHALQGFAASVPVGRLNGLQRDPRVASVERDQVMSIAAQTVPTGIQRSFAAGNTNLDIDGSDDFRVDVDVAVLDTGIDLEHPDLNVVGGIDCTVASGGGPPWARTYGCSTSGNGGDDDHYHGTHVAGTIGAIDNGIGVVGIAPGARLWAVKVLDSSGSGYTSGIVAGIDWVVAQGNIEVLNMSLGGSGSCTSGSAYDEAIDNAYANGVAVAVAAGNSDANAANYSPASCNRAFAVSALADFDGVAGALGSPTCRTDQDDTLADFSNWGSTVKVAAPGVCITSTYPIEQGSYGTISGTSMASPHVAGAFALLASGVSAPTNGAGVQAVYNAVVSDNFDWTDDSGDGVKEPLLDLSATAVFDPALVATGDGGGTEPSNDAPTASFTYSCTDLSCSFNGSGSSDPNSDPLSYSWTFGDGATATGVAPVHTYDSGGDYQVTLTVGDGKGGADSQSQTVTVTEPTASGITLGATPDKVKGVQEVHLRWSGATTGIDVYEDDQLVLEATANDGEQIYIRNQRGGGSATYKVCETGTDTCSNSVTVTW